MGFYRQISRTKNNVLQAEKSLFEKIRPCTVPLAYTIHTSLTSFTDFTKQYFFLCQHAYSSMMRQFQNRVRDIITVFHFFHARN